MSEYLPKLHYLDPEILQKLDVVLSEFFFRRESTLNSPSAGARL